MKNKMHFLFPTKYKKVFGKDTLGINISAISPSKTLNMILLVS